MENQPIADTANHPKQIIANPPKKNLWKLLVVVLVALLLGMGGLVVFLLHKQVLLQSTISELTLASQLTPTNTPVLDENNYKSPSNSYRYLGMKFTLPEDWTLHYHNNGEISIQPKLANSLHDREYPRVLFWSLENPRNLNLAQLDQEMRKADIYSDIYTTEGKPIIVSDVTGYYKENKSCDPNKCDMFIALYKSRIYGISFLFTKPDNDEIKAKERAVFNQILSTFKFSE